ncbi:Transglutaminase-like enzyme, putative cysteine protease [Rhodoferax sp. OV413]|uniref:transglutaminase-like domain-containing protein n=1 Tax=Rhodoferax sp. OV413 TaxID=1855285 RepID=UPI0008915CF1|nr:transglutaminase family protein [Rhodoferax sp. OV413]SDP72630.1 Transglutaminase-like enzyme, putative cysteine protease [Rhodoferax sp. OV413]
MFIKIGFDIELAITSPMAFVYLLHVHPSRSGDLWAPEHIQVEPGLVPEEYYDAFGNLCGRVNAPAGVNQVRFQSQAVVRDHGLPDEVNWNAWQHDPTELPTATLQFLLPSRYCEVDSELLQFAWNQFGQTNKGWARVQAICDFVHNHIRFDYMAARATRTAVEGFREGTGVCRDYTHLAVTLCRCMNIPARYCTGYLGDIGIPPVPYPMDFSAWFEVYLGDRWYTFDARHNTPRIGRVVMARGRDAGDVPITMAFGQNTLAKFEVTTYEVDAQGNAV